MVTIRQCIAGLAGVGSALAASSCAALKVKHTGVPTGELKNVSGSKDVPEALKPRTVLTLCSRDVPRVSALHQLLG
jgi:hypothetical protein